MAQRRMFSPEIIESEDFLALPVSSQALYLHLAMNADDDGFIQPQKIMRMVGSSGDDLKILLAKRFILSFQSGVVVIKHWLIHNLIRGDRYKETRFIEEKNTLKIKDNKAYTELDKSGCQIDNQCPPQVRLGKVRLGEVREGKVKNTSEETSQIVELINSFKEVNPSYSKFFANKSQRSAFQRMLKVHGLEKLQKIISFLPQSNTTQYMPVITTPIQLEDKFAQLATAWQKIKNNTKVIL